MGALPIPFGNPSTYPGHSGVDFGQRQGTPILASGVGIVTASGYRNSRAGYATSVQYSNGPLVAYCHQPENGRRPAVGTRVTLGSFIGEVGNTGRSTGPHLHMEILQGKGAGTYAGIWNYFTRLVTVAQALAMVAHTPIATTEQDDLMRIFSTPHNGSFFIAFPDGIVGIRNPEELVLLRTFLSSVPGKEPGFTAYQRDVINYYLQAPRLSWGDLNK